MLVMIKGSPLSWKIGSSEQLPDNAYVIPRNLSPRDLWTKPLPCTWIFINVEHFLLSFSVKRSKYLTHLTAGYDAYITNTGHEFRMQVEGRESKQATQLSQVSGTSYSQCPYQCMLQLAKPFSKSYRESTFTRTEPRSSRPNTALYLTLRYKQDIHWCLHNFRWDAMI